MKKTLSKVTSILFLFFIFSCGGNDNPRSVADKFLGAMSKQDFETAKKYGTEETQKLLEMMSGFTKMANDSASGKEMKFDITKEKTEGDNATVYYKEEGREGELQLPLVKVGGKWKVVLSKETINNSEGGNSMDVGATNTDTTGTK